MKLLSILFLIITSSLFLVQYTVMGASWTPLNPPAPALVGSEANNTWYVRPKVECSINGNGLSYECAESLGGSGAFNSTDSGLNWTPVTGIDAGDTVYVCGLHTTGFLVGPSASGTPDRHITIRFDCPRNPGRILNQTILTEALQAANWVKESEGVWYLSLPSYINPPKRVWLNDIEHMQSEVKSLLGQSSTPNGPVRGWWFDAPNKRLYLPSTSNPSIKLMVVKTLSSTNVPCSFSALCFMRANNKFFDIINPNVGGGGLGSVYILGATDIRIFGLKTTNDCEIGRWSHRGVYITDSTGRGTGTESRNIEIFNCNIDPRLPESIAGYAHEFNGVTGDGILLSEGSHDNSFHDLIIIDWQHTGFSVEALRGTTTIRNNVVSNTVFTCRWFVEYCRPFGIDGSRLNAATGNVFRNNKIVNMTVRAQFNGNGNLLEGNLFTNQRIGGIFLTKKNISQVLEFQGYAGPSQGNIVKRNIFLNNTTSPCISFNASNFTNSNHIIEENIFINCGGLDTPGAEYAALYLPNKLNVGAQTIRKNRFIVSNGHLPIMYRSFGFKSVVDFETSCSDDICTNNFEIEASKFEFINDAASATQCGLGMWWQMSANAQREYICFH